MIKTYKYRIYPSKSQQRVIEQTLDLCCELYNAALQERRDAWRICKRRISCYEQQKQLTDLKTIRTDLGLVYAQVLCEAIKRLDRAFDAFFRRLKAGKKAGFPRFRSRSRYDSFTYPQQGFAIKNGKLSLSKIGMVKIKLHRPIEGKVKTCTIIRNSTGKWFTCFTVECAQQSLPMSREAVGVDVGLKEFAILSNGETIANPKFLRGDEKRLAKAQRRLSATKKGSPERNKRRKVVALIHECITNKRRDFAHQESRKLVNRFAIIIFENLNITGLLKNHHLAKSIADAAWGQLVSYTQYKAANAGRKFLQVNPRNTSQICSGCGRIIAKALSVRIHHCESCDLTLDRDHNAAINILALGLQSIGQQTLDAAPL